MFFTLGMLLRVMMLSVLFLQILVVGTGDASAACWPDEVMAMIWVGVAWISHENAMMYAARERTREKRGD